MKSQTLRLSDTEIKPRFVVLFHELRTEQKTSSGRASHWDLMLENDGVLETWALEAEPVAGKLIAAVKLPDHRLIYLDYQGQIPKGRGSVKRVSSGYFRKCELTYQSSGSKNDLAAELTFDGEDRAMRIEFREQGQGHWLLQTVRDFKTVSSHLKISD